MRAPRPNSLTTGGLSLLSLALLTGSALAQNDDWLKPTPGASTETYHATTGPDLNDPFAVLSTGALWQDKYGETYARRLDAGLTLSCETSDAMLGDDRLEISRQQKLGFQFQPIDEFHVRGDFHGASNDTVTPATSTKANGIALSAEGRLPTNSVLTLGLQTDRSEIDVPSGLATRTDTYDAQIQQPLGKLPLSAVLKSHLEQTTAGSAPTSSLPTLEQSLVWKPLQNTTVQMGLRQQQYQEYPGIDHQLNEALFADWSQHMADNISWHSYAEVLNSKGLLDQAPASSIASGTNGTAQASNPVANTSLTSSLPLSLDDQTVTFTTGPSFQLQKDISASVEYSNRWDKNPAEGSIGQEQRVSVSLKGTF